MNVIVDFSVRANQFGLGRLAESSGSDAIEVVKHIVHDDRLTALVSVPEAASDDFRRTATDHDDVQKVETLTTVDSCVLFRLDWSLHPEALSSLVAELNGTVLRANTSRTRWTFCVQFLEYVSFKQFERRCQEADIDITTHTVYEPSTPESITSRLTPAQRETLAAAYRQGYFEIPRGVSLAILANQFGISEQATSQRIRRGLSNTLAILSPHEE